ncbi:uncharacterized protein VTP21DRAFT_10135 [Calcarisporiella thermophila]|uniref:uncharacterized protein n=1 Tax=Calcarisporiella thermophila TaxID=911321 RepID=UPI0037440310
MQRDAFPTIADASTPLPAQDLEQLRIAYQAEADPTTQTQFNFAWGLIKSRSTRDRRLGVQILTQIYHESPERRRELVYLLALGHFRTGEYRESRRFVDAMLGWENLEEESRLRALELRTAIEERVSLDGLIGIAIVSSLVAVVGVTVVVLWKKLKSD